jgi:hypothetical protein
VWPPRGSETPPPLAPPCYGRGALDPHCAATFPLPILRSCNGGPAAASLAAAVAPLLWCTAAAALLKMALGLATFVQHTATTAVLNIRLGLTSLVPHPAAAAMLKTHLADQ